MRLTTQPPATTSSNQQPPATTSNHQQQPPPPATSSNQQAVGSRQAYAPDYDLVRVFAQRAEEEEEEELECHPMSNGHHHVIWAFSEDGCVSGRGRSNSAGRRRPL